MHYNNQLFVVHSKETTTTSTTITTLDSVLHHPKVDGTHLNRCKLCTDDDDNFHLPFWFGNEEPIHVKRSLQSYSNFLQLNKNRSFNSRRPLEFIGKVTRNPIEILEDEQKLLKTIDQIEIYECIQAYKYGLESKLLKTIYLITLYDYIEGLPISHSKLKSKSLPCTCRNNCSTSYLYCFQQFTLNQEEFIYQSAINPEEFPSRIGFGDLMNRCVQKSSALFVLPKSAASVISDGEDEKGSFNDTGSTNPSHHQKSEGISKDSLLDSVIQQYFGNSEEEQSNDIFSDKRKWEDMMNVVNDEDEWEDEEDSEEDEEEFEEYDNDDVCSNELEDDFDQPEYLKELLTIEASCTTTVGDTKKTSICKFSFSFKEDSDDEEEDSDEEWEDEDD
ncbi:hypothetical protein ABK040_004111 [Willaertia magna]